MRIWRKVAVAVASVLTMSGVAVATTSVAANALVFGTSSIAGKVTGPTGTAVPFAEVASFQFDGTNWVQAQVAFTGFDGTYSIGSLPDGVPLQLEFLPGFNQTLAPQWFDHAADQTTATTITLAPAEARVINAQLDLAPTVSGRVTLADGTPLNGSVTLYDPATGKTFFAGLFNGTYTTPAEPGSYVVYAQTDPFPVNDIAPEYYGQSYSMAGATPVVITAGAQVTGIDVTLAPGAVITGHLLDASNNPIVGGGGIEMTNNGPPTALFQPSAAADATGVFTIVGVPTGTYAFQFTGPQSSPLAMTHLDVTATAGATTNVDVHLDRGVFGVLALHDVNGVVPSSGQGGNPTVCDAGTATPSSPCGPFIPIPTQPSPVGDTWIVGPMAPGDYTAVAYSTFTGIPGAPFNFTALPGQGFACDLALPDAIIVPSCQAAPALPTGTVSGHVVGPDGVGLAGVTVTAQYGLYTVDSAVQTDANGDYTMPGVWTGDFRIRFQPPDTRPDLGAAYWSPTGTVSSQAKAGTVTVGSGTTTTGIDGQLSSLASGTVLITKNGADAGFASAQANFCPRRRRSARTASTAPTAHRRSR